MAMASNARKGLVIRLGATGATTGCLGSQGFSSWSRCYGGGLSIVGDPGWFMVHGGYSNHSLGRLLKRYNHAGNYGDTTRTMVVASGFMLIPYSHKVVIVNELFIKLAITVHEFDHQEPKNPHLLLS